MPDDTHHAAQHRRQASSFGAVAAAYERGRPPYPPEAVHWLLPAGASRVLDLGAGTGKLTRQLRDRGSIEAWATMDAGPHVKVLCAASDAPAVESALAQTPGVLRTFTASPGRGVEVER